MESMFILESVVRGYHIFQHILECCSKRETTMQSEGNHFAVAVLKDNVGVIGTRAYSCDLP